MARKKRSKFKKVNGATIGYSRKGDLFMNKQKGHGQKRIASTSSSKTRKRRNRSNNNRIALENKRFVGAHDGQHGFSCSLCARHMMEQIALHKKSLDSGSIVCISNGYNAAVQIRRALGFLNYDNYFTADTNFHGEFLSEEEITRLLLEHKDLFQDAA